MACRPVLTRAEPPCRLFAGSTKFWGMPDERSRAIGTGPGWSRRSYIVATTGSAAWIAGLSGCAGGGGAGEEGTPSTARETEMETETERADGEEEERPEGVSAEEFEAGPVPPEYRTAAALGGEARDPSSLLAKADVGFAEYEEAEENPAHRPGTCCANCDEYVVDRNGDTFGACTRVAGYVDGADWCTVYESLPEPEVPAGTTEDDLATAEVPAEYRTAASQAGEARDPAAPRTQAEVNLTESVAAIAEGVAPPGRSCGNGAEFLPDQNGDGWGACAKVEGYVAVEDYCVIWEHVSEA